jgi:hypothetical protein
MSRKLKNMEQEKRKYKSRRKRKKQEKEKDEIKKKEGWLCRVPRFNTLSPHPLR